MKKELLTVCIFVGTFSVAYGNPEMDMTVGGAPFQVLQQQAFERMELEDYKKFKDAQGRSVESRMDSPQKLKQEYKIKGLRSRKAKMNLNSTPTEEGQKISDPANMEFVQKDGKVIIKYAK